MNSLFATSDKVTLRSGCQIDEAQANHDLRCTERQEGPVARRGPQTDQKKNKIKYKNGDLMHEVSTKPGKFVYDYGKNGRKN